MNELLKINYDAEQMTVSARDLHEQLNIESNFTTWFKRMCEYGFEEGKDFFPKMEESTGGRPSKEFDISVDMAKEICMIQRSPEGRRIRQYFIELEKAWNTPEQIMARALKMANQSIESLKQDNAILLEDNKRMRPKEIFADAVSSSNTSILIGELAKILRQNGVQTGQRRLFTWLRENGYLVKSGSSRNMPTQRSVERGLFEIKVGMYVDGSGANVPTKTAKVTGKGQQYFINKFLDYKGELV